MNLFITLKICISVKTFESGLGIFKTFQELADKEGGDPYFLNRDPAGMHPLVKLI